MRHRTDFVKDFRNDTGFFEGLGEDPMKDPNIKHLSGYSPTEEKSLDIFEMKFPLDFGAGTHTEYMNDGTQSQDQLADVVVRKAGRCGSSKTGTRLSGENEACARATLASLGGADGHARALRAGELGGDGCDVVGGDLPRTAQGLLPGNEGSADDFGLAELIHPRAD